ncbi:MAG: LytTR family DNA-binding domain-containing protein [Ferruginibacter sp.]
MITAIIVDDEVKNISVLNKILLDYCEEVKVVGTAGNITDAEALIKSLKPALVFLDVEMPYGTGFDLLNKFTEINFEIIFVTAYDQYAIDAFQYASIDYLLKPVNIAKLKKSIERVQQRLNEKTSVLNYQLLLEQIKKQDDAEQKIQLSSASEQYPVKYNDILYCIADGSYTFVHMVNDKKFHASKNLKQFTAELPASIFFRIHNGHLVNLNHVSKIIKGVGGSVIMSDGKELEIAVRRKEEFLKIFK